VLPLLFSFELSNQTGGLTNIQQSLLVGLAFILAPLGVWLAAGAPMDHTSLALLGSNILSGVIMVIKEALGSSGSAIPTPQVQTIPEPSGK